MTSPAAAAALAVDLASEAETAALAARLAPLARAGDVIALAGELGTGKTSFARAFIRALRGADEEVPSPTFTLVEVYEDAGGRRPPIWHFDLYRLKRPEEAYELGLEAALAGGIALIEWPERLGPLLPRERLLIRLRPGSTAERRSAALEASPLWRDRLARLLP